MLASFSSIVRYEYHWADGTTVKKPIKCSAPKYIDYLMTWVQEQLDDENIFPSKIGMKIIFLYLYCYAEDGILRRSSFQGVSLFTELMDWADLSKFLSHMLESMVTHPCTLDPCTLDPCILTSHSPIHSNFTLTHPL